MSQAHDHAAGSTQSALSSKMDMPQGSQRLAKSKSNPDFKDQQTVASGGVGRPKNKQSLDYALKTGLAGGLAGIAVRTA